MKFFLVTQGSPDDSKQPWAGGLRTPLAFFNFDSTSLLITRVCHCSPKGRGYKESHRLRLLSFGAEVVGEIELECPFLDFRANIFDDSFQGTAADLNRY
jgi:hypothetical protein